MSAATATSEHPPPEPTYTPNSRSHPLSEPQEPSTQSHQYDPHPHRSDIPHHRSREYPSPQSPPHTEHIPTRPEKYSKAARVSHPSRHNSHTDTFQEDHHLYTSSSSLPPFSSSAFTTSTIPSAHPSTTYHHSLSFSPLTLNKTALTPPPALHH